MEWPEPEPWSGVGADGWDGTQGPDDLLLVSASSVPKILASPGLDRWHINRTIDLLLEQLPKLDAYRSAGDRDGASSWLRELRYEPDDDAELNAADSGSLMHRLLEAWCKGEAVDARDAETVNRDPVLTAMATNLWEWFHRFKPEPVAMEFVLYDPGVGVAGRADLLCTFPGLPELGLCLVDLKNKRKGQAKVYADSHALQLATYRYSPLVATFEPRLLRSARPTSSRTYLLNRAEIDACKPNWEIQTTAIIANDPERCRLFPVDTGPNVHRRVREAVGLHRWVNEESRGVVGSPVAPAIPLPVL